MRAELVVPLLHKSRPIGALNILSSNLNQFTDRDVAIVTQFAAHVAVALVNARLFERSRLDAAAFETLAEIGRDLEDGRDTGFEDIETAMDDDVGDELLSLMCLARPIDKGFNRLLWLFPYLLGGCAEQHYVPVKSDVIKIPDNVSSPLAASAACALQSLSRQTTPDREPSQTHCAAVF